MKPTLLSLTVTAACLSAGLALQAAPAKKPSAQTYTPVAGRTPDYLKKPVPVTWTLADTPPAVQAPVIAAVGGGVILKMERVPAVGERAGGESGFYRIYYKDAQGRHELRVSEAGQVLGNAAG